MDFAHVLQQVDRLGPIIRVPPLGGERVDRMGAVMFWGTAALVADIATKRRLRSGVFT